MRDPQHAISEVRSDVEGVYGSDTRYACKYFEGEEFQSLRVEIGGAPLVPITPYSSASNNICNKTTKHMAPAA